MFHSVQVGSIRADAEEEIDQSELVKLQMHDPELSMLFHSFHKDFASKTNHKLLSFIFMINLPLLDYLSPSNDLRDRRHGLLRHFLCSFMY